MKRRILSILLALSLCLGLLPAPALAAEGTAVGAFTVEGGAQGTDYEYADGVLTISRNTPLTIRNTDPGTPTTDRIEVKQYVSANVTLAGVNIDVSATAGAAAFKVANESTSDVSVTLAAGTQNTLISGSNCAGLQMNCSDSKKATLNIKGTGSLTAQGGKEGAGIGSALNYGSHIAIHNGNITATGGQDSVGVGGISNRCSGTVTITGGTVNATGGVGCAGIGGLSSKFCTVTISGGNVTAKGGNSGGWGYPRTGINGAFSTGTAGSAIIHATGNGDYPGISDVSSQSEWSGLIFNGSDGMVGGSFTLSSDLTIEAGQTLGVMGNGKLTIAEGAALTNNGTLAIENAGSITGRDGALAGSGTFYVCPLDADRVNVPTDLVYDGTDKAAAIQQKTTLSTDDVTAVTACAQSFTPDYSAWKQTVMKQNEMLYTVSYALGNVTVNKDVVVEKPRHLMVTGGTEGSDYTYADTLLTVLTDTPLTITNSANVPASGAGIDRIEVAKDVDANITLAGVNIDVSANRDNAAFKVADNSAGNVTVTLAEGTENILHSGSDCAGLQANNNMNGLLTIGGAGALTAMTTGRGKSAGIGTGDSLDDDPVNLKITGGTINAVGGDCPGIGSRGNSDSQIVITGGTINATGYMGIGVTGTYTYNRSIVEISGGTVTATTRAELYKTGINCGFFRTGENGAAQVIAKSISERYPERGAWKGMIFDGDNGVVGGNFTLDSDFTIDTGKTLVVKSGAKLTIPDGVKLANKGTLIVSQDDSIVCSSGAIVDGGGAYKSCRLTPEMIITPEDLVYTADKPDLTEEVTAGTSIPTTDPDIVIDGKTFLYDPSFWTGPSVKRNSNISYTVSYTYSNMTVSKEVPVSKEGDFEITGGTAGKDYAFVGDVLTVKTATPLTIANKDVTAATADHIVIADGVNANLTLAGVNIDVSTLQETPAFLISDNSTGNVTITLAEGTENTLKSGGNRAGLQKNGGPESGTLTIEGPGALTATGLMYGAGIGGSGVDAYTTGGSGCNIVINGGTINAKGGYSCAGIGGSLRGTGIVTINGGNVTATSISVAAAIGGGNRGDGVVTITGGTVTADAGESTFGAGIGSSDDSDATVTITGGFVTVIGGNNAYSIGNGRTSSDADHGTFSCSGDPIIRCVENGLGIGDESKMDQWNGVIFDREYHPQNYGALLGKVYGTVTLRHDLEIPANETQTGHLTIPAGTSLTVPADKALTNKGILHIAYGGTLNCEGTLDGDGTFETENLTADMIAAPTGIAANGLDRSTEIAAALTAPTATIGGQTFAVVGWTKSVAAVEGSVTDYVITYTKDDDSTKTVTKTITLPKSGTQFVDDGAVTVYKGDAEATDFTYGETVTVKANPTPTGQPAALFSLSAPTAGQMALYLGERQVSAAADKGDDGKYTMTVSVKDLIAAGAGYGAPVTLTAKFVENDYMTDGEATVEVTLSKQTLTPSLTGSLIKVYDGTGDFTVPAENITLDGLVEGDDVTATAAATLGGVNAGDQTFTGAAITLAGGDAGNYALSAETLSGTVTITQKPLTVTAKDQAIVYGERIQTGPDQATAEGLADGDMLSAVTVAAAQTDAGTHTNGITASNAAITRAGGDVTTNYDITYVPGDLTIDKATPTVTAWPTASAITYGQALAASDLTTGGTASVAGIFTWKEPTVQPTVADSGVTQYAVTFTPGDPNYNTVTGQITLTVNKATPTVTPPTANTLTYTDQPQALVAAGSTTGGELQYSADGVNYSADIPKRTNAGDYTVYYKVVGDGNYNDVDAKSVAVTISQKALDGTVTVTGAAAMNETLTASYSDSDATVDYQWYRGDAAIDGATGSSYTLAAADVGQTVKVKATGTGNYTGNVTSAPTAAVTEALPTITTLPTAGAITYGQALSKSALTGGEASVAGTFSWTDGAVKPAVSDSETAKYRVTFTPSVDGYTTATGEITVTVAPAPLTITAVTPTTKTYDATAAAVCEVTFAGLMNGETLALGTGYTVEASYDSAEAGTRTLTATVTLKNGNYALEDATFEVTDASITPKVLNASDVTVTVTPDRYEYTGSAITPTQVTVKHGATTIPAEEYALAYQNNTHVGTATVTVSDADGGNYSITGETTASFEITKLSLATSTVTLGQSEYTYDATAKEPTVTVTKGGAVVDAGEYEITYANTNGGEGDHTSAGTVTVTVTAKADGDYFGSNTATFTISPRSIDGAEIALGGEPTYSGAEQAVAVTSVTVDGLTATYEIVSGEKGTDAGEYTLKLTGSGNFTGTAEKGWSILPASLSGATFAVVENQDFADREFTPKPAVTLGGKTLAEDTDFTYTYADNKYVGTATVNISGKGNYTGAAATGAIFTISPVSDPAVIVDSATVTKGGNTVDLGRNVTGAVGTVSYALTSGDGSVDAQGVYTSPAASGSAVVTVTVAGSDLNGDGVNEYTEKTADVAVTITDKTMAALDVAQTGCTFGEALPAAVYTEPAGTVATAKTYTGQTRSGAAYESAAAPTDAGTYTVKVVCETATHLYEGTSASFTIAPKPMDGAEVTLGAALTYNTQSQTQSVSAVTLDGVDILSSCDVTGNAATNAGEYTLTVTAKDTGNYTGSVQKAYTVSKKAITPTVDGVTALDYTGSQLTQSAVVVKDGADTLAASDYEITYGENITAGPDAGSLTVKAKEGGNYSFSDVTVTFTINKIAYPGAAAMTSEAKYGTSRTVDLTPLLAEGYELGTVSVTADTDSVLDGTPAVTGTMLTFAFVNVAEKAGKTATIQVPVTGAANYLPYNVTVTVTVTDKLPQNAFKFVETAKSVVYGETLDFPATGAVTGSKVTYASSDPTVAAVDETGKVTALHAGNAVITAIASATEEYAQASVSYTLQVDRATVTVKAIDRGIYVGETVPDLTAPAKDTDYTVTGLVGEDTLVGTVEMKYQLDGEDVTPDSAKAGSYDIMISGVSEPQGGNYNAIVLTHGKLTISTRPHSGGESSGKKVETEKHEDGSVTTTVTDKRTGTKTETTKYTDGSETVVTTQKDGSQMVTVTIPAEAVEAALEKGEAVRVQMPDLIPAESAEKAIPVTVYLSGKDSAKVEFPVEGVTPGTVAITVNADGTEEIVKTSIPTEAGIALTIQDGQTIKLIDNSKMFEDVAEDAWYAQSVAFVVSRELFNGTSGTEFSPNIAMSRGMLVTVLYRLENEPETANSIFDDVPSGQYYADAVGWAAENHIVDGYGDGNFGPDDPITREQLAVLLWRYAGSPASTGTLDGFIDAGKADTWAADALRWAVEQGIITGKGGGILDPTGQATRAEVAAMLMRYIQAAEK